MRANLGAVIESISPMKSSNTVATVIMLGQYLTIQKH